MKWFDSGNGEEVGYEVEPHVMGDRHRVSHRYGKETVHGEWVLLDQPARIELASYHAFQALRVTTPDGETKVWITYEKVVTTFSES